MSNNFSKATIGTLLFAFLRIAHDEENEPLLTTNSKTSYIPLAPFIIVSYALGTIIGGFAWAFMCGINASSPSNKTRNNTNDPKNTTTGQKVTKYASRIPFLPLAAVAVVIGWLAGLGSQIAETKSANNSKT